MHPDSNDVRISAATKPKNLMQLMGVCPRGLMQSHRLQVCSFSVLTGAASPLSAPISACQERIAHFTRAGYL